MSAWGSFLMKIPVRVSVVIVALALLGAGVYGTTKVEEKFDLKQLGTDGSYFVKFQDARTTYFPTGIRVNIILDVATFDYSLPDNQRSFSQLDNICIVSKYHQSRTINWMTAFHRWSNNTVYTSSAFYTRLQEFLQLNPMYHSDILFTGNTIRASRMICWDKDVNSWSFRKDGMLELRNDLKDKTNITGLFAVTTDYFYTEQLVVVKSETIRNLVICAIAILVITTPYLVHPGVILIIFLGFVALIFELFALMAIWNVALNSISMIVSIMSIGFAVDYSAHIAHAYMISNAPTPEARIIEGLGSIGASVLMGGISTFLGIVITGFGKSEIFRIFFKMVFGIVVIGLLNGLVFLPVFLSIFCRTKLCISDGGKDSNEVADGIVVVDTGSAGLSTGFLEKEKYGAINNGFNTPASKTDL